MIDNLATDQPQELESFSSKTAVILVRKFGSWASVIIHTLIIGGWFVFEWEIEKLLIIVSIEAIYIGIFILMAENIESAQKEIQQEIKRKKDMSVVKMDAAIDRKSLREIEKLHKKIDSLQRLIRKQNGK